VVFDHHSPLEHSTHTNLLAIDHRIEAAADLVIEGWDDAGQRNEINDLAHVVASLWLAVTSRVNKKGPNHVGSSEFYQNPTWPPFVDRFHRTGGS
jgi:hypothetical protein